MRRRKLQSLWQILWRKLEKYLVISVLFMPKFFNLLLPMPQNQIDLLKVLEGRVYIHIFVYDINIEIFLKKVIRVSSKIVKTDKLIVNTICSTAQNGSVDLIDMGKKGITGLERVLLVSLSSGVVTNAHCSILVVR